MALSLAVFRASQPARASAYSQAPAGLSGLPNGRCGDTSTLRHTCHGHLIINAT